MKITFITPCSRPENINSVHTSIFDSAPKGLDTNLVVVIDADSVKDFRSPDSMFKTDFYVKSGGISGNPQRNTGLDIIKNGYVAFLDDDNIMHHAFLERVESLLDSKYNKALVVNQAFKNGTVRLRTTPENIGIGHVDSAQVVLPRRFIGNIRWIPSAYVADGIFIKEVFDQQPDKFIFLDEAVSYYNYLR